MSRSWHRPFLQFAFEGQHTSTMSSLSAYSILSSGYTTQVDAYWVQHWLQTRVTRWAWHPGTHCVAITPICHHSFRFLRGTRRMSSYWAYMELLLRLWSQLSELRLKGQLSPSILKVYVAAIVAHHDAVNGKSLGKHDLIMRFLRCLIPSWDLSVFLLGLQRAPFGVSWVKHPLFEDGPPEHTHFQQEGGAPAGILSILCQVSWVCSGILSHDPVTPTRLCAQSSHYLLCE